MENKTDFIWMDGKLVPWENAKIHVLSHSLHYGGGVFEGERCYETTKGTSIFRLQEHTERLFRSAAAFKMQIPFTEEEINKANIEVVSKNKLKSGYIRPIVFYGYGKMGLNPSGAEVNVVIAAWPWGSYLGENSIKVKITNVIKTHPGSTDPVAKICGNYQNSILASQEIKEAGYDEALLLDFKGNVAEGPGENFFMVKNGEIFTPTLGNILPGITRNSIMEIANNEGIKITEKVITPSEAKNADEAFFSGTAAEVTSIGQIDDAILSNGDIGPITKKIKQIYFDAVHGKDEKYSKWLTFVD